VSDAFAYRWSAGLVSGEDDLALEFEARLKDSSALAFRVAFSVLRHREDAEDVAQDAFVRAHRALHQLRDRERFRAWLVRLTWRLALDRRRQDMRRSTREEAPPVGDAPIAADDALIAAERGSRLWAAIDALPDKLRLAIVLSAIDGHDVREVARLLRVPEGTVKSRLAHARRRLQEILRCSIEK
jgi:RNA polymerase sigma-70 factor (ECF subfamily)